MFDYSGYMARIACALVTLICAVAIGVNAVSAAGGSSARGASPSRAASVEQTSTANESAAQTAAASLLTELSLPANASQSAAEPSGDESVLAHSGSFPATPNLVDDHAWWLVPGAPAEVLAYVNAHLPSGSRVSSTGWGNEGAHLTHVESETIEWPAIVGVLSTRELVVEVVRLPNGSTGLRADAEVVWVTPRPASETIPPGSRILRISVHGSLKGEQPTQRPLRVTSTKKIEKIVALLNALPAAQPGAKSCPADFGIDVRLAFYASRGAPPLAVAGIDPQGCGGVQLKIYGKRQPGLESGSSLIQQIDHVLGVKLDVSPR
jgi:hypothetical protein